MKLLQFSALCDVYMSKRHHTDAPWLYFVIGSDHGSGTSATALFVEKRKRKTHQV